MRLHGNSKSGRIARACLLLSSTAALAGCGVVGGGGPAVNAVPMQVNGPQADYPVIIGAPYSVGDTQYSPADVLNYDEVGYLAAGTGEGITGGHHTLPYPSYVEVTSLETGRTILVRLEQRGPMESTHLISLSPAAMAQLEASQDTPIRVRRVNPPEEHRSLLRRDEAAPLRMDTPTGLVEVLRRRLPSEGSASVRASVEPVQELPTVLAQPVAEAPAIAVIDPSQELPAVLEQPVPEGPSVAIAEPAEGTEPTLVADAPTANLAEPVAAPVSFQEAFAAMEAEGTEEAQSEADTAPTPAAIITDGFVVQAAAFSTMERAERAATALEGRVEPSGRYFRVRTGPFATRAQAEASLANVRAAGYTDARIYTTG